MFDKGVSLHLSYDTVSNQWRDPMEQPRTFCGQKIAWYVSKQPNWTGDEVVDGIPVCSGCRRAWHSLLVPR